MLYFHLRDGNLRAQGMVDARLLRPLARWDKFATIGRVCGLAAPAVRHHVNL